MPARRSVNPLTHSIGYDTRLVTIIDETSDTAICVDRQGNEIRVPLLIQRSKGQLPSIGDNWLVSQDFGTWAFQAFIGGDQTDFINEEITNGAVLSPSPPVAPSLGDIWINSITGIWSVWNGTAWIPTTAAGGAVISPTAPLNPTVGMLWCDSSNGNIINIWDGTQWDQAPVGTNAITAGAIVAGLIAAGAIDGFVINGTIINGGTITGGEFITSGTTGVYLVYTSGGNIVQTFKTVGAGTWTCPAGVTTVQVESWGAGGGGATGTASSPGGGGGGGEYALQSIGVTPTNVYNYTIGGGAGPGANGGVTFFTGDAATVTGNGGHGGTTSAGGQGASGSSNTTEFQGGAGSGPVTGSTVIFTATAPGTNNWIVPSGVSSIKVECWGAGAGGNAGTPNAGGYGGGGGAYARVNSFAVTPGHSFSYTVGQGGTGGNSSNNFFEAATNGTSSSFNTNTCIAAGGKASTGGTGQGGQASASTGNVKFSGGNGGTTSQVSGAGGGSSAGTSANGNNGQNATSSKGGAGGAAPAGGAAGGAGGTDPLGVGQAGSNPGGGGGGTGSNAAFDITGPAGGNGQVRITYTAASGGGGGGSGGTASAGKSAVSATGAQAVSGGGPGGNGQVSSHGSGPSTGPGGGGGGGGLSQIGGSGFAGQIRLTYLSTTPVLSGSIAGAAGTDPFAATAYPEGAKFDNLEISNVIKVDEIGSAPGTPTGGGYLYVDATGHLHYKGPGGTDTTLAGP